MAKFTVDQWSDEGSNDESPYWIIWGEDGNSKKYVYDAVIGEALMYYNDIIAAQALEIERLRKDMGIEVQVSKNTHTCKYHGDYCQEHNLHCGWPKCAVARETLGEKNAHTTHCNVGEYEGSCKYGDDDCPEL